MVKQVKKNTIKKTKKANKNIKKIDKKTIIICISIFTLLLLIILLIVLSCHKKIKCTRSNDLNGIKEESVLVINFNSKKINNITIDKIIDIEEKNEINYLSIVETSLKDAYKNLDIDNYIKKEDNKLKIKLKYNEKKEYIIDNIFVNFEDNNLSVNVISEDINNQYLKFDLSKKYSKENIIELLEKYNFVCK